MTLSDPFSNETGDDPLSEGLRLYDRAKDYDEWPPLMTWLAKHPELAHDFARYIKDAHLIGKDISPPRLSPVHSGSLIGGLELREEIGHGGMGVVYRAFDPVLKRDVAVKLLRTGSAMSAHDLARFRFEAEVVASFDHPNVVRVFSSGEADGAPYLVMPLMTGGSLATRLNTLGPDRRLPEKEVAKIVRDIALGVHHAHQRGLIHRDLKPGNILLDESHTPHVADFGLARRVDVSEASSAGIAGTVAYMAPEQARGDKQLTTAVDVHALGVILFELLTGNLPYGGTDIASILQKLNDPAVHAPSIRQYRPDVPADLEAICLKCLEKLPEDRYRSADELAEDLTRFLNGELPLARPVGFWDWLRQISRTHPEPNMQYSWPVTVWFGAFVLATNAAIYGIVQNDASAVWVWVANLTCGAGLGVVLWWYMLRKFRQLPVTERHSLIIASGKIMLLFALTAAYAPLWQSTSARSVLAMYPALAAATGLGLFTLGSTNWSRFFPVGAGMMALAPVLAWWPESSPLIYGVATAVVMWYWSVAKARSFAPHTDR